MLPHPVISRLSIKPSSRLSLNGRNLANILQGALCKCPHLERTSFSKGCNAAKGDAAATAKASSQGLGPREQLQQSLDDEGLREYVAANPVLYDLLGGPHGLTSRELLDGVINLVYAVRGPSGSSAIFKQALPYVRAVGESFPLSRDRMDVEAAAMQLLHSCCPDHIPELLLYDPLHSVLAMQYLPPPHEKLLYAIRKQQVLPGLAHQLAELLSSYLAGSSTGLLTADQAAAAASRFANVDIVTANEQVVLIGPFNADNSSNRWTSPQLDADVQAMWGDAEVLASAAAMLGLYRLQKQALIHNDLHAGNLLVAPGSLYLIDWEFATVGPMSFDLGCLLGNLMLALLSLQGMAEVEERGGGQQQQQQSVCGRGHQVDPLRAQGAYTRKEQAEWLLQVMHDFWVECMEQYPVQLAAAAKTTAQGGGSNLWAPVIAGAPAASITRGRCGVMGTESNPSMGNGACLPCGQTGKTAAAATTDRAATGGGALRLDEGEAVQLLADSCGFAGCCLIRLTVGLHHYPDIQSIQDVGVRVAVERRCLWLGQQLLRLRAAVRSSSRAADAAADDRGAGSGATATISISDVQLLVKEACGGWL